MQLIILTHILLARVKLKNCPYKRHHVSLSIGTKHHTKLERLLWKEVWPFQNKLKSAYNVRENGGRPVVSQKTKLVQVLCCQSAMHFKSNIKCHRPSVPFPNQANAQRSTFPPTGVWEIVNAILRLINPSGCFKTRTIQSNRNK